MSRLIKAAQYSGSAADAHIMREAIEAGEVDADNWEKAARTIEAIDPEGDASFRLLRRMMVGDYLRKKTEQ